MSEEKVTEQFISVITDEAMQRVCYDKGWSFTPYMFGVSTKDILEGYSEDQIFNEDGTVNTMAYNVMKQFTTSQMDQDDYAGNIWCQLPFSSLSKATATAVNHHIVIPANLDIDGETKQIKTIYFIYKDVNNLPFLYAVARANSYMIYEAGVTQSFFFNFTITNSPSQDISQFVINYTYPQDIEAHNTSPDEDIHPSLMARNGERLATGIFEYDKKNTFTKPNQLVTMQYVQEQITEFVKAATPAGFMTWWPGTKAPEGYAIRNGQWLSCAKYPQLYSILGDRYGSRTQDGVKQFRLMDDCGVFIRGCETDASGKIVNNTLLKNVEFAQIQECAAPNIKGQLGGVREYWSEAFYKSGGRITLSTRNGSNYGTVGYLNANRCSTVYKDGITEIRPKNRNYLPIIKLG